MHPKLGLKVVILLELKMLPGNVMLNTCKQF